MRGLESYQSHFRNGRSCAHRHRAWTATVDWKVKRESIGPTTHWLARTSGPAHRPPPIPIFIFSERHFLVLGRWSTYSILLDWLRLSESIAYCSLVLRQEYLGMTVANQQQKAKIGLVSRQRRQKIFLHWHWRWCGVKTFSGRWDFSGLLRGRWLAGCTCPPSDWLVVAPYQYLKEVLLYN